MGIRRIGRFFQRRRSTLQNVADFGWSETYRHKLRSRDAVGDFSHLPAKPEADGLPMSWMRNVAATATNWHILRTSQWLKLYHYQDSPIVAWMSDACCFSIRRTSPASDKREIFEQRYHWQHYDGTFS
jgi:hypothetical protein